MTRRRLRLRNWAPVLPLVLLLAATYWLSQQVQPLAPVQDRSKRHDPDAIVYKFSAVTLNNQGTPRFIMSAQQMTHYPDDNSAHLEEVQLSSLYTDRPAIYTTARHGEVTSQGDDVFLRDEVKLVRAASATQSEMTFTTTYLHVIPDQDLAETDRPVTLVDAQNEIHAVGMQFDHKARAVKLLAQVNARHDIVKN
ncbi:MAG: LPS export ABC transporter periplasmic protein LptC [Pseudomonadota bacterium]